MKAHYIVCSHYCEKEEKKKTYKVAIVMAVVIVLMSEVQMCILLLCDNGSGDNLVILGCLHQRLVIPLPLPFRTNVPIQECYILVAGLFEHFLRTFLFPLGPTP